MMKLMQRLLFYVILILYPISFAFAKPVIDQKGCLAIALEFTPQGWNEGKKESALFNDYDSRYQIFYPEVTRLPNDGLMIRLRAEYFTKTHALSGTRNDESIVDLVFSPDANLEEIEIFIRWFNKTRYRKTWKMADFEASGEEDQFAAWKQTFMKDSGDVYDRLVHVDKHEGRYFFRDIILRMANSVMQNVVNKKKFRDPKWVVKIKK